MSVGILFWDRILIGGDQTLEFLEERDQESQISWIGSVYLSFPVFSFL